MNEDTYANALKTALTEVRNICPDVTRSFIFARDGTIIAEAAQDAEVSTEKKIITFQSLIEKADAIGGLNTFLVNGNRGVAQISRVNNMYLVLSASKKADMIYIQSIVKVIIPTVLKLLENIVSIPLKPASQNLMADNLTGLFAGETAQVDNEVLKEWSKTLNDTPVEEVEIEAPNGRTTRCKIKVISEREFKGKGLIRIPEKIYRALEVGKGEPVKVKPIIPEGRLHER